MWCNSAVVPVLSVWQIFLCFLWWFDVIHCLLCDKRICAFCRTLNLVSVFFCMARDISVTVTLIGVKVCMIVDLCPRTTFSPFSGDIFRGQSPNVGSRKGLGWTIFVLRHRFLPFDCKYLETVKSEHHKSIRA